MLCIFNVRTHVNVYIMRSLYICVKDGVHFVQFVCFGSGVFAWCTEAALSLRHVTNVFVTIM
jgi:hypothetical protein